MKVYLIERSTMAGSDLLETAYACKRVAEIAMAGFYGATFDIKEFNGELFPPCRVIVGDRVYKLVNRSAESVIREIALNKLTEEEKEVLGLVKGGGDEPE